MCRRFVMLKYLAAFALANLGGAPTKAKTLEILKASGAAVDVAEFESVWPALEGKALNGLIAEGASKLSASAPAAGGSSSAAAPAAGASAAAPAAKKVEEKKVEEEEDGDMGFGLFD